MRRAGMSPGRIVREMAPFARMHDGVWLVSFSPATERQRHRAATLTEPGTVLSHVSAAAFHGIREHRGAFEVVARRGTRGPHRVGDLLVTYSSLLDGHWTRRGGIPVMDVERTVCDLAAANGTAVTHKLIRVALAQRSTTIARLSAVRGQLAGRRGTACIRAWLARYGHLPIERCRSDAEARGLEVLHDAHVRIPEVNVLVAGFEADFVWPDRRVIVEIDGPQWHRDLLLDARKTAAWRAAGYDVRRVPSEVVFDAPDMLVREAAR